MLNWETIVIMTHTALFLGFSIRVFLRDDLSSAARLAWFMVILVLPVFGSFVYFLFGEVDIGRHEAHKKAAVFKELHLHGASIFSEKGNIEKHIEEHYQPAFKYAASINGFFPVNGNKAELMRDAKEARRRIIEDIDAATSSICILYYIWLNDQTGTQVAEALMRAAKRGVHCRIMADGLGSKAFIKSEMWQRMIDSGIDARVALPLHNPIMTILKSRIDLRNHRKITIIDGRITYCGSRNCADPEFRVKAKYAPWTDILLRFEGPVVAQNKLLFASDWVLHSKESLDSFYANIPEQEAGFPAQVVGDGPTERAEATPQLFASLLYSAKRDITISTPYFVPDANVLEALLSAGHRGVKTTLIFPKKNDSWVVAAVSRSFYKKLLEAGVHIYEHSPGLLHAKTLTIDGVISLIGSSNLDLRSFNLNYENNILLQNKDLTEAIYARQMDYLSQSTPVTLEEVNAWSYLFRIKNNLIGMIGPVL